MAEEAESSKGWPAAEPAPLPGQVDGARPTLAQQQSRVSKASSRLGTLSGGRASTLRSQMSNQKQQPGSNWERVVKAVRRGTLVAVGLKQTNEEKLHWNALQRSIQASTSQSPSSSVTFQPRLQRLRSHISYHEVPAAHLTSYPYHRQMSSVSATARRGVSTSHDAGRSASEPGEHHDGVGSTSSGVPPSLSRQQSQYGTGRIQAVRKDLKPDLWKMAYKGVRRLMSQTEPAKVSVSEIPDEVVDAATPPTTLVYKSFIDLGEEEVDAVSMGTGGVALGTIREDDEDFFGEEIEKPPRDIPDAPIARLPPPIPTAEIAKEPPHPKPTPAPRGGRIGLPQVIYDPLFGGYDRGYGGLGLSTHLLRFKYITVPRRVQQTLDSQLLHKRPYFTYWLMVVHIIVMVTALSVYGFAPYGWDQQVDRGTVLGSNLAFDTEERIVIPNVWGGPSQQSLVLLGALYGPCMRRDRQLFEAIDQDRNDERNQSGCCVRLDESGCVQERNRENCPRSRTADFVDFYIDNGSPIRGVCGTSPRTCTDPRPGLNSDLWIENDILTWPICLESNISDASGFDHLTCDITGRPCCVGIQAHCTITTREHCDFLQGRFHQDAFLCSQVDCLNDTCGLLPFAEFNEPDQFYRLWIALFMHAGLFHLILSLIFSFLILRHVEKRLGWLRTSIIYIFSGIGGNLVSVFFVPYNPEVGPAGSILGVVAYMFVFLIFESRLLVHPWQEFLKLGVIVLFLLVLGLFPFIDNFAHIGGFVFGFLFSGILVPYHSLDKLGLKSSKKLSSGRDYFRIIKWAMVIAGIPAVLLLFALFFVLFYVVQDTWDGFRFVNCIPFTDTICQDLGGNIRTRDTHII